MEDTSSPNHTICGRSWEPNGPGRKIRTNLELDQLIHFQITVIPGLPRNREKAILAELPESTILYSRKRCT